MTITSEKTLVKTLAKIGIADLVDINHAKCVYAAYRGARGFMPIYSPLLTDPSANLKLSKSKERRSYGLSLSPANVSGAANVCPFSTKGCRHLCLNTSGNGMYPRAQLGRIIKTQFLVDHPVEFLTLLVYEIDTVVRRETSKGNEVAMRLNVLSDIRWEDAVPWIFTRYPDVQFYDYTKHPQRDNLPGNYHITWSASERMTNSDILDLIDSGHNVAVVSGTKAHVPDAFYGRPVINGDISDYRPADAAGTVVWLSPKGKARKATPGGFVRTTDGFHYPKDVLV